MKRQILFRATATTKKEKLPTKPIVSAPIQAIDIYSWIQDRPFLNLNGICTKLGVDRANFVKAMKANKPLKDDIKAKLITELKNYGYAE